MLLVLSPSKTLDFASPLPVKGGFTVPRLLDDSQALIARLRTCPEAALSKLMGISPKLAALNAARYRAFHTPFTVDNARPALFAFRGDVYEGLAAETFTSAEIAEADQRLRILSGLYGVLRPRDLIQPYRLEMGTRLATPRGKNLYAFWGTRITEVLNADLAAQGDDVVVNLASQEYFAAIRPEALAGRVVTPLFKERKGDTLRVVGLHAKRARGEMAAWILRKRPKTPRGLRAFTGMGYRFAPELSHGDEMVFAR